jgi:hypothetical protein
MTSSDKLCQIARHINPCTFQALRLSVTHMTSFSGIASFVCARAHGALPEFVSLASLVSRPAGGPPPSRVSPHPPYGGRKNGAEECAPHGPLPILRLPKCACAQVTANTQTERHK